MCTEVNSVMGLQATAATKRKHEITFDGKEANTYTNCSPPIKVSKWSKNNNSLAEALEEKMHSNGGAHNNNNNSNNNNNNNNDTTNNKNSDNKSNNINNGMNCKSKSCTTDCNAARKTPTPTKMPAAPPTPPATTKATTTTAAASTSSSSFLSTSSEVTKTLVSVAPLVAPSLTLSEAASCSATTPLPPTASSPIPEDSIAKLEEVAAAHCEPWHGPHVVEPVDCISKLQAVAVPSDPWGSIATRSTLATTLLSADEIDDDDDDFEDDYEEEESIIPTYCPLRYHPFAATPISTLQPQRAANYATSPTNAAANGAAYGSGTRPNYYSEPFPQQNCSRTGSPQHMRLGSGAAFPQWSGSGSGGGIQQFYVPPEAEYPPPQQQQTIRCAENGKSYLDLGCSTPPAASSLASSLNATATPVPPPISPYSNSSMQHVAAASAIEARHAMKRCCDGRGTWCNTNKHCYKDIRMKIRNLSMFKLSRFRQVSEQSLYRSVLICNTLKYIDREIEAEAKEIHQAAHAAHQHHQFQHLHHPHHLQHHHHHHHLHHSMMHHNHPPQQSHMQQQQQQQQPPPQPTPPPQLQQPLQDYSPVLSCARVANIDYQPMSPHHQQSPQQQQPQQQPAPPPLHFPQQQQSHLYNNNLGLERLAPTSSLTYLSAPLHEPQKSSVGSPVAFVGSGSNNCDHLAPASSSSLASLHPYDHYPFRESQSGRATPFPNQPVISSTPASTPIQQQQQQQQPSQSQQTQPSGSSTGSSTTALVASSLSTAAALEADSSYADDDCTRSINWSSVLSLSSQSALDPLNNNELFSIISAPTTSTAPANINSSNSGSSSVVPNEEASSTAPSAVSISGSFTTVQTAAGPGSSQSPTSVSNRLCNSNNNSNSNSGDSGNNANQAAASPNATTAATTATFTTLSTISSATYSMTSSYASNLSQQAAGSTAAASSWEYGFLDMDFGLGSEFTELMPPSCKLSSDELYKSGLTPVATSRYSTVHDNELEQPAHIMVGS